MKKAFRNLGITGDGDRHPDDFYGSVDEGCATRALLLWLTPKINPNATFWDPACGAGNIAKALREVRPYAATDLNDRGWDGAATGIDFLATQTGAAKGTVIVSNPPFKHASDFIVAAHRSGAEGVVFLLKSTYFQASRRLGLFNFYRPRYILPLTWRIDFTGQGAPVLECSWFVWFPRDDTGLCEYIPLPKPPINPKGSS